MADRRGECAVYALICVCIGLAWQFLTVHYNYGGNWTALYISGSQFRLPPDLVSENVYVFQNSSGYDGQMYHYIAHDPFMQRGYAPFMDNARFRYRRILLPALAFILAGGRQSAIDAAYIVANLLFLFLGAWWIGRYLAISGRSPTWAILFVLVPAVLTSLDRLTIDLSMTALCMGFLFYARIESRWRLCAVLVLACLTRETGVVLIIAFCVYLLARHRFVQAALFATAALPASLWYLFVNARTPEPLGHLTSVMPVDRWSNLIPLRGIVETLLHPFQYPGSPVVNAGIRTFDYLAMAGILMACVLAFYILYKKPFGYIEIAAALWAGLALCLPSGVWVDCCSSGRVFSPLLIFLVLRSAGHPAIIWALPLILVSMRTWLQLVSPLLGIVRGVLHHGW
jgi:hypothetical protein